MAAGMWFLRYMRRMPWTDRNMNEAVLKKKKTDGKRKLFRKIRRRHSKSFGFIMRRNKHVNLVTPDKFGRHIDKYLDEKAA